MKAIITILGLCLFTGAASAATMKVAWNLPLDHPTNVAANARVTSEPPLLCTGTDRCKDEKSAADREDREQDRRELLLP